MPWPWRSSRRSSSSPSSSPLSEWKKLTLLDVVVVVGPRAWDDRRHSRTRSSRPRITHTDIDRALPLLRLNATRTCPKASECHVRVRVWRRSRSRAMRQPKPSKQAGGQAGRPVCCQSLNDQTSKPQICRIVTPVGDAESGEHLSFFLDRSIDRSIYLSIYLPRATRPSIALSVCPATWPRVLRAVPRRVPGAGTRRPRRGTTLALRSIGGDYHREGREMVV